MVCMYMVLYTPMLAYCVMLNELNVKCLVWYNLFDRLILEQFTRPVNIFGYQFPGVHWGINKCINEQKFEPEDV